MNRFEYISTLSWTALSSHQEIELLVASFVDGGEKIGEDMFQRCEDHSPLSKSSQDMAAIKPMIKEESQAVFWIS
jgi:hypothetical protein